MENQNDQRNFILAIVLTMGILLLYQVFFVEPQARQRQAAIEAQREATASAPLNPTTLQAPQVVTREEALSRSDRIILDTPSLDGSIALKGARFDDINLKRYRVELDPASAEVTLLNPPAAPGGYYAVLGWEGAPGLPDASSNWQAAGASTLTPDTPLVLNYTSPDGLQFTREITVDENYMFAVTDTVENVGSLTQSIRPYGAVRRHGLPADLANFYILHEGMIGVLDGKLLQKKYKDLQKGEAVNSISTGGWLGITDKYWLTALVPSQTEPVDAHYRLSRVNGQEIFETRYDGAVRTLEPGQSLTYSSHVFAGAKRVSVLDDYMNTLGVPRFDDAVDWGNFWFLTKPFFWVLEFFHGWTANFGIAILLLTVVVKVIFFPVVNKSYEAMTKLKKLQPKMEEIKERFAADKQRQQQEMIALYQREKVNPVAGCLPMLIQIPVFYALYKTLFVTIEMRHAPFFGWIKDLSAPDPTSLFNLFGLLPYDPSAIPVIGTFLAIGALPIMYGVTMFVLQGMSPAAMDPLQRKIFMFLPLIFTFVFAGFAAGLVLYWTWSNVLSIAQQYLIMRRFGVETTFDKFLAKFAKAKAPS
jgi:YidC/Oxa1 family membrane protein insertase